MFQRRKRRHKSREGSRVGAAEKGMPRGAVIEERVLIIQTMMMI